MTLNSLPIKDKFPFSHAELYLSVSPYKGGGRESEGGGVERGGDLFMPNMAPVLTSGHLLKHFFLIKSDSISFFLFFLFFF